MMNHTGGWMDGWLGGRRYVDLNSDRRTGGNQLVVVISKLSKK
jgi:hypothetical protein